MGFRSYDPAASSQMPADSARAGWIAFINGDLTPINIPAGVETKITLDADSGAVIDEFTPQGVTKLWDSTANQFDFSELAVGDMLDIRIDGELTNTGINESFSLSLVAAIGTAEEFVLPFSSGVRFVPGTSIVSRYNGLFMGTPEIVSSPAELRITSSSDSSGFLMDMYIKIIRRSGGL